MQDSAGRPVANFIASKDNFLQNPAFDAERETYPAESHVPAGHQF